jgi:hypothetical protein
VYLTYHHTQTIFYIERTDNKSMSVSLSREMHCSRCHVWPFRGRINSQFQKIALHNTHDLLPLHSTSSIIQKSTTTDGMLASRLPELMYIQNHRLFCTYSPSHPNRLLFQKHAAKFKCVLLCLEKRQA